MRFTLASLLVLAFAIQAPVQVLAFGWGGGKDNYPKPSGTPGKPGKPGNPPDHWDCPDNDNDGHGKDDDGCDKWPFKSSIFACTFNPGKGNGGKGGWDKDDGKDWGKGGGKGGSYTCTFDADTGACTGGGPSCPVYAHWKGQSKRAPEPVAAPVPRPRHSRRH